MALGRLPEEGRDKRPTPGELLAQRNRRTNELRREAQEKGIRSPFRQSQYINARLAGQPTHIAVVMAEKDGGQ